MRRNARISVGLSRDSKRLDLDTTFAPRNTHIISRNWGSPFCCASQAQHRTANANDRNVHPCGACSPVRPLQGCILHASAGRVPSLDSSTSNSSLRVHFTPATVNSPSTPAMFTVASSTSSSTLTLSSSTSDSATSNLTPSSSAQYDPFHANPLLTHTRDVHTRAAGDQ